MTENKGDLISRSELKKALKSGCEWCHDANTNWCEHCCKINDFEDLIDDAPTVYPICEDKACKYRANERPQGEWLFNRCNNCGAYHKSIYRNFCPNCGADMKPKTCTNCETFGEGCGDCEVGDDD